MGRAEREELRDARYALADSINRDEDSPRTKADQERVAEAEKHVSSWTARRYSNI